MFNRILVLGASGSGTTTIGKELSNILSIQHIETDELVWESTEPPFLEFKPVPEIKSLMHQRLLANNKWILSGSPVEWGDDLIPFLDLIVFITAPTDIRISRIIKRDTKIYGDKILPGGIYYDWYMRFIDWAKQYDVAAKGGRTLISHQKWLATTNCLIKKVDGSLPINHIIEDILSDRSGGLNL